MINGTPESAPNLESMLATLIKMLGTQAPDKLTAALGEYVQAATPEPAQLQPVTGEVKRYVRSVDGYGDLPEGLSWDQLANALKVSVQANGQTMSLTMSNVPTDNIPAAVAGMMACRAALLAVRNAIRECPTMSLRLCGVLNQIVDQMSPDDALRDTRYHRTVRSRQAAR